MNCGAESRNWRRRNDEGHYGEDEGRHEIFFSTKIGIVGYSCEPESIGQYTGLTDKNGKKIFEGDIVEFRTSLKKYYAKVYYKKGMWSLYIKGFNDRYMLSVAVENDYSVKVIGNIHDNPELLEVTK